MAKKKERKPLLLDIMLNGRFVCQLKYNKRGLPDMVNGEIVEVHNSKDLEAFVLEQRPSLRGKDIKIEFASQKVL